ncbi:hypothetical protein [Flavonifractor sp. An9]|uniref:hypothetical protein n=1 Tax=Flavonifractor sp. An9 TaxID=1965664 RepID=UPI000B39F166|nr:hypothetical protein [Flavonifractor sp. An9]OUN08474.1 hypothetical protein B5G40_14520 [Flavonifractor sp. An9]
MILYDDKTKDAIKAENQLIFPNINESDDITFKASYIISGHLHCTKKIFALFDLIVFGDVTAEEIDIKGRFVCMGRCSVSGTLIVQNDIWAEDIQAKSVICQDRIVGQSIDADTIIADGNIIIGKTLAIEKQAKTYQNVICGETAYGAGKIVASSILTAEPLDLDDGEEALESPFQYTPQSSYSGTTEFSKESAKHVKNNDYSGFLSKLMKIPDKTMNMRFRRYLTVLRAVEMAYPALISEFKDAALLIWLIEISNSNYFKDWPKIKEWTESVLSHFKEMADGKISGFDEPKPATSLAKGYTVFHKQYGRGVVRSILQTSSSGKVSRMAIVEFEQQGEKKFPLPDSLKFFSIISEHEVPSADEVKSSIQCNIDGYSEWLSALQSIHTHKAYLGTSLYNTIYSLLLSKLGLKPKFVEDRFKEKGWN